MNSHVLSEIEMLANRVAIIERGKVVAQDELRNLLAPSQELYSVAFEANGHVPEYVSSVERMGSLVKGLIPKARLYEFMEMTRSGGLLVHECSLKKTSLEDSFFKIVKGDGQEVGAGRGEA
jgi:ABC-2 type transport system ATP-binding protein